jgi:hypothetical protein
MLARRKPIALLMACALASLSGCGDEEGVAFKKGGPPAPRVCLERWNADEGARSFGRHAYVAPHNSRAAQVFRVEAQKRSRPRECAVIFAVSESDREYGTVGQVSFPGGWELMTDFPVVGDPAVAQRKAATNANARVDSEGRVAPLR